MQWPKSPLPYRFRKHWPQGLHDSPRLPDLYIRWSLPFFFFNPHPRMFFKWFGEREGEGERWRKRKKGKEGGEREGGREKGRKTEIAVWETSTGCPHVHPDWGLDSGVRDDDPTSRATWPGLTITFWATNLGYALWYKYEGTFGTNGKDIRNNRNKAA